MNAHTLSADLLAPMRPHVPNNLGALTAHAAAAHVRFTTYAGKAEIDPDEFRELEQADHDARQAVRAKLAEMDVDPKALRVVLS